MIKLLHCADLHLSGAGEEREYCLSVLEEITSTALRTGAQYLILAGDIFNSFSDAEALRDEFRERMKPLHGRCEVIFVTGNHENIERKGRLLASFDLGIDPRNIIENPDQPFMLLRRDGVEFFVIPHREHYGDYSGWNVPEKERPFRVAVAHGIVAGMSFTWQDEETSAQAGVIDPDIFERNKVDYAALGHIHSFRRRRAGMSEVLYPGSARVWRKNESGPRRAALVTLDESVEITVLELAAAGQYRCFDIFMDFEGTVLDPPACSEGVDPADFLFLRFTGLVEDERKSLQSIRDVVEELKTCARRVDYETDLLVLAGISAHLAAKKFLQLLEAGKPSSEGENYAVWKRAREMGLLKIKEIIEAGS